MNATRYFVGREITPERLAAAVEALIASPQCEKHGYWNAMCSKCNELGLWAAPRVLAGEETA